MDGSRHDESPARATLDGRGGEERSARRPARSTLTSVVWIVLAVAAASLVAVSWNSLRVLKKRVVSERRSKARAAVEMAHGAVLRYGELALRGELSRDEAQQRAAATVRASRYDDGGYVWINDLEPRMVMHPAQPELEGRDLTTLVDPDGKVLFLELSRAARADPAGGFVSYRWPKPTGGEPVRKLSFVKLYEPWGWIIGSGIYLDDLDETVAVEARRILGATALLVVLLSCAGGAVAWNARRASRLEEQRRLIEVRARAERGRMMAQLAQADRLVAMGTLAAGAAHEINNPLAYVMAGLEFIAGEAKASPLEPEPPDRAAERQVVLAEMREGCERIRRVVRDLKLFSRADAELSRPLEVQRVLDSSIKMAFNEIRHRAKLARLYGPIPPVHANDARLGQVFLNLLINAAHAIHEGAAASNEIRVVTRTDDGGRAVVEIHDTGTGIAPEHLERIFEPFFTTKPVGVGTGLGLPICRDLVTAMDGTITLESEIGRGTTFRVTLPAARAAVASRAPPLPSPGPSRRGRVLAIDDELPAVNAVRRALAAHHDVVMETSAAAATARIASGERFDAIVCDLMMPEKSGMDLRREVAALDPTLAERMVFLTGGAFTSRAKAFVDSMGDRVLEKPFAADALRSLVGSLVGRVA